jgi:beta-fructofuranosidase
MAFTLTDFWVWDFWLADDGDQFHLFYLHAPKSLGDPELRHRNARFGHATSADLTNWSDLGPIFGPGAPGDFDETATWTGSVLQGPDGLWRMFYTGSVFIDPVANANVETIGVATSVDLHTWTKQPGPLTAADPRWYELLGTSNWPEEAWRDPWVYPHPDGRGWRMLITARSAEGDLDNRGVIGQAYSADLEKWEVLPPLSAAGAGFSHLEVPQTVDVDGHSLLLFSCDTAKLSRARIAAGGRGGIWVVNAPDPSQPFDIAAATLLVDDSLYSGRLIRDRDGRWVMLAFDMSDADGDFVGSVTDPVALKWDEATGTLQVELETESVRVSK